MESRGKWILLLLASSVVVYAIVVLGYLTTTPDLRLRCLIVDDQLGLHLTTIPAGVQIHGTPGIRSDGRAPRPGDWLVQVRDRPTRSFLDVASELMSLRNAQVPPGYRLPAGTRPSALSDPVPPPLLEIEDRTGTGHRWVRIKFQPAGSQDRQVGWLQIQPLPLGEVVLTFLGFVLQLGVFAAGALAYWNRPFDRSARLFFAMCIATLGAFVGGYHWWVIAGRVWLLVPFVVCAALLPAISLHFFLVYPRTAPPLAHSPRLTIATLYTPPALAIAAILGLLWHASDLHVGSAPDRNLQAVLQTLGWLRETIYGYFAVAATYFVLMLVALWQSYRTTPTHAEHHQLKWIWRAGLVAACFIGYTLLMALFRRVDFAMGAAKVPMFLASFSFMLAYTVAILRHKLLLVEQIVTRGVLYYVVSAGVAVGFSLLVAMSLLAPQVLNISLSSEQALMVALVLMLAVLLLLWLRDRIQQILDREFFREKYRLDEALQRINRTLSKLREPGAVGEMMLASCRDVLGVDRSALYLRTGEDGAFRRVASQRYSHLPAELAPDAALLEMLREGESLQRITVGARGELSPVQNFLRRLESHLVHPLQAEGEIVGLVLLGEKVSGASFSAEDLTFLNALGQITNVTLQSAKVIDQHVERMNDELRLKLEKIAEQRRQIALLQAELTSIQSAASTDRSAGDRELRRDTIKGNSPAIIRVLETVRKVAPSDSSVLVRGESGTGKELLAQVIHDNSPRRAGPMIRVHCAALSAGLLESELFGHVKGAFTGAHQDKVGRFEAANGGTIFLDEIGDISLETQIKLLRVLQERCFEPVGSSRAISVDVRLITATHQNLEDLIADGRFREDLYYRLNVISITLPPLRERPEDIFELALHFLNRSAGRTGKRMTHIDDEALTALESYSWPGNIREMENVIERAVVLAEGDHIALRDLPLALTREASSPSRRPPGEIRSLVLEPALAGRPAVRIVRDPDGEGHGERELLEAALRQCGGNTARAARQLGMPRSTFFSKLKKHGLR